MNLGKKDPIWAKRDPIWAKSVKQRCSRIGQKNSIINIGTIGSPSRAGEPQVDILMDILHLCLECYCCIHLEMRAHSVPYGACVSSRGHWELSASFLLILYYDDRIPSQTPGQLCKSQLERTWSLCLLLLHIAAHN